MAIKIMLADDHTLFRSGLRALLDKEVDFDVVKETSNGYDTVREALKQEVDLLVLDISMPGGLSGSEIARSILERRPGMPIVVLTMHDDEYYLKEFLHLGVKGFVLKKSTDMEVFQAIRTVHQGGFYIDTSLAAHLVDPYIGKHDHDKGNKVDMLTKREQEICAYLAYGHTSAEIARRLDISNRTAEKHRAHIMEKLNLKSRADLVRFAIDNKLMKLES